MDRIIIVIIYSSYIALFLAEASSKRFTCYYSIIVIVTSTVEAVLKRHPIGHQNVVCQDRWSLVTGSVTLKCRSFCQKCVVCQDRWSLNWQWSLKVSLYYPCQTCYIHHMLNSLGS